VCSSDLYKILRELQRKIKQATADDLFLLYVSFPSSGLGMPTLKLCLTEHKDKPVLFIDTPSGAWQ
jgi:hypothetical protein